MTPAAPDPTTPAAPLAAIPAATLVIMRDRADAPPDLLLLERAARMVFAPGAMVFPGGRIDPGDHPLAAALGRASVADDWDGAARVAAIRETIEEAGLAIGIVPAPAPDTVAAIRSGLARGEDFAALLTAAGLSLDFDALIPFARWRPAHRDLRIFDTRFFLARAPEGAAGASVDATENVRLVWAGAQATLFAADAGIRAVIYPTRRNLERLARFATYVEAAADAARHPVRVVTPWIEPRGGVDHLCIPADLGYPVTAEPLGAARRG